MGSKILYKGTVFLTDYRLIIINHIFIRLKVIIIWQNVKMISGALIFYLKSVSFKECKDLIDFYGLPKLWISDLHKMRNASGIKYNIQQQLITCDEC